MSLAKILRLTRADMSCIEKAILYIDAHYKDKISAEHLAIEIMLTKEKLQAGLTSSSPLLSSMYMSSLREDSLTCI